MKNNSNIIIQGKGRTSKIIQMLFTVKHCNHKFVYIDKHWKACKKCPLVVEVG